MNKVELALDLADGAEQLVRMEEVALNAPTDPTARDVQETRLREALELQDQVLESVGPVIEERGRAIMADVRAAIASLRGDPGSDWWRKHRRRMSAEVKSRLIRASGKRLYEEAFPW